MPKESGTWLIPQGTFSGFAIHLVIGGIVLLSVVLSAFLYLVQKFWE